MNMNSQKNKYTHTQAHTETQTQTHTQNVATVNPVKKVKKMFVNTRNQVGWSDMQVLKDKKKRLSMDMTELIEYKRLKYH